MLPLNMTGTLIISVEKMRLAKNKNHQTHIFNGYNQRTPYIWRQRLGSIICREARFCGNAAVWRGRFGRREEPLLPLHQKLEQKQRFGFVC